MLPKAHLTLHSRMSGSKWVITPLWLSGSWRYFLYSSVHCYHLFLISSASLRSVQFLSFIVPIFAWNVPLVSLIFLKRSNLSHPIFFFLYFFTLVTEEGFFISEMLLNHKKTQRFLASGEEFNPGPETRLDRSELLCNKVLLKYKWDREGFWQRHQKGVERVPPC